MACAPAVPGAAATFDDAERVVAAAARFPPETIQLAYQICTQGRADLALAPDESTGFTMTLLRLLAFEPARGNAAGESQPRSVAAPAPGTAVGAASARSNGAPAAARAQAVATPSATAVRSAAPASNIASLRAAADPPARAAPASNAVPLPAPAEWPGFVASLKLTGMAAQLAAQTELRAVAGNALTLALPASHKHLADKAYADKLKGALESAAGRKLLLAFEVGESTDASLAARERRARDEAKANGEQAFREEPFVRDLLTRFD